MRRDLLKDFDRFVVVEDEFIVLHFKGKLVEAPPFRVGEAFAYHGYVVGEKFKFGVAVICESDGIHQFLRHRGQGGVGEHEEYEVEFGVILKEEIEGGIIEEFGVLAAILTA
jgi:hypothetical protein